MQDWMRRFGVRNLLLLDAACCVGLGLLLLGLRDTLAALLALPTGLLAGAGLALLPIGVFIAGVALFGAQSRALVDVVVLGNVLWVAASLALLLGGPVVPGGLTVAPNALGVAFVLLQAAAVAGLAWAEHAASRLPAEAEIVR